MIKARVLTIPIMCAVVGGSQSNRSTIRAVAIVYGAKFFDVRKLALLGAFEAL